MNKYFINLIDKSSSRCWAYSLVFPVLDDFILRNISFEGRRFPSNGYCPLTKLNISSDSTRLVSLHSHPLHLVKLDKMKYANYTPLPNPISFVSKMWNDMKIANMKGSYFEQTLYSNPLRPRLRLSEAFRSLLIISCSSSSSAEISVLAFIIFYKWRLNSKKYIYSGSTMLQYSIVTM